jgi:hypothetical protein
MITKFTKHFQAFWDSGVIGSDVRRCLVVELAEERRGAEARVARASRGAALLVIFVIVVVFVAISLRGDQTIWELGIGSSF